MSTQSEKELYRKTETGEFELVGYEFCGWPANGIWLVEDNKSSCIYPFNDVPDIPSPSLVSYMKCRNELEELISDKWKKQPLSVRDVAEIACEFFAIKAGAIKTKNEIIEG